ncbi:unnamed protein product, partial [Amoebophrya sp. A25]|eukprot:GSA25T00017106001.1
MNNEEEAEKLALVQMRSFFRYSELQSTSTTLLRNRFSIWHYRYLL